MLEKVLQFVGPRAGMAQLTLKEKKPEVLLGVGIAAGIGGAILLARAHKKSEGVFADVKEAISDTNAHFDELEENDILVEKGERRRELIPLYVEGGRRAVILYGPSFVMGVGAILLILSSNRELRSRNKALIALVGLLERGFSRYRARVVDEYGEEVDERFYYDAETRTVNEVTLDENGKKKKTKDTKNFIPENPTPQMYSRVFDEWNTQWRNDQDMNEWWLTVAQKDLDDRLKLRGWLTLNDVYEYLQFPPVPYGQVVGWSMKSDGDHFVDFGLKKDINQRPGEHRWYLDFNVNGYILSHVGEK